MNVQSHRFGVPKVSIGSLSQEDQVRCNYEKDALRNAASATGVVVVGVNGILGVVGVFYPGGVRTVSAFLRTPNRTGVVPSGLPSM